MKKIESSVQLIPFSQERVYAKLSDMNNLKSIQDKIPADKVQDFSFDDNSISFSVAPVGSLTLEVVEREPCKCIKFETSVSPIPFKLWIQLVPSTEEECKIKLTIGLDINPMMAGMIQKPLQDGLEKMASALATIPY
ncbi:SRPBCC family protein [Bacteroides sp. 214]|uniref:SRPBCC family protein n=1 Tax=Bacteroides sp. 214 TaxID=2302935 RepID=UPI0013D8C6E6|nr:SRPBCC family protein [Bacteroides sp. 214]NDW12599.1 SRPBCC family protein [Bacteroides sp. 214]